MRGPVLDVLILAARLLVSAVFLVAGVAKLCDREGSREALVGFGVPARWARWLGVVLPVVECGVGLALVPAATAWAGGLAALALLLTFMAGIGVNLARGHSPPCHCFGQLHSAPAGWGTLGRNAALAGVASFILLRGRGNPGPDVLGWLGTLSVAQSLMLTFSALGLALLALQSVLLVQVLRQQGRFLLRMEAIEGRLPGPAVPLVAPAPGGDVPGLPVGAPAPRFVLRDLSGHERSLDALWDGGRPLLLFFSNPNCGPCMSLLPEVAKWHSGHASSFGVVVVSEGTVAENLNKAADLDSLPVLVQERRDVAEMYQAYGTPAAVLVRPDGSIGSPLAMGAERIRDLVWATVASAPAQFDGGLPVNGQALSLLPLRVTQGEPPPPLTLLDPEGAAVPLDTFRGQPTVILFWNPACGFCEQILDDVRRWDSGAASDAPSLVVVSSGTPEQNRAMRLRSPVLSDNGHSVRSAFGAHGTPMAVLLDADGRVASPVVGGTSAVLSLAGLVTAEA